MAFRAGAVETRGIVLWIILRSCRTIRSGACLVLRTKYGGNGGTVRNTGNWGIESIESSDLDYTDRIQRDIAF